MTIRKVKVFQRGNDGTGCFVKEIDITTENFVSENADTITIWEPDLDAWGGTQEQEALYYKNIDLFIQLENARYVKSLEDLRVKHEKTLKMANECKKMANECKRKGLTPKRILIPL